ncbi:MAG: MBL fold metallo-hydrolase [Blautia sp.]|nr:MBL fold metallo-hydrolase [Blautia sp.]
MRITWLGHSCFQLEKDGFVIILDPYGDGTVPGLGSVRETADLVLCSHEHGDHNGRDCVALREGKENPFTITQLASYHDEVQGKKRGNNLITIVDDGTAKAAHMGDIGCPLDSEQVQKLQGLDVLLIPVGGFFTIDAAEAAQMVKQLKPKYVVPMHFRNDAQGFGFDMIQTVEEFTKRMDDVAVLPGSELDTDEVYPSDVLVLQPRNVVK